MKILEFPNHPQIACQHQRIAGRTRRMSPATHQQQGPGLPSLPGPASRIRWDFIAVWLFLTAAALGFWALVFAWAGWL